MWCGIRWCGASRGWRSCFFVGRWWSAHSYLALGSESMSPCPLKVAFWQDIYGYMSSHEGRIFVGWNIHPLYPDDGKYETGVLKHSYYIFYLTFSDFSVVVWCKPVVNAIGYSFQLIQPPEAWKLTCSPPPKKGTTSKGSVIFQALVFRGHVSFCGEYSSISRLHALTEPGNRVNLQKLRVN